MNLIQLLDAEGERVTAASVTAELEYRKTLERAHDPRPGDAGRLRTLASALGIGDEQMRQDACLAAERAEHKKHVADLEAKAADLAAVVAGLERQRDDLKAAADAAGSGTDAMLDAIDCGLALASQADELIEQWLRARNWRLMGYGSWKDGPDGPTMAYKQAIVVQAKRDTAPFKLTAAHRIADAAGRHMGFTQLPITLS